MALSIDYTKSIPVTLRIRCYSRDMALFPIVYGVNHPPKPAVSDQRGDAEQFIALGLALFPILYLTALSNTLSPTGSHTRKGL